MPAISYDYVSGFVPEFARVAKPHKFPLHWRGRIVIGLTTAFWVPIIYGFVSCMR